MGCQNSPICKLLQKAIFTWNQSYILKWGQSYRCSGMFTAHLLYQRCTYLASNVLALSSYSIDSNLYLWPQCIRFERSAEYMAFRIFIEIETGVLFWTRPLSLDHWSASRTRAISSKRACFRRLIACAAEKLRLIWDNADAVWQMLRLRLWVRMWTHPSRFMTGYLFFLHSLGKCK